MKTVARICLALAGVACVACAALAEDKLLVGWASMSITPSKAVALSGQWHTRISKSVHDPVTATALAIEGRNESGIATQAILISCDLVGVNASTQQALRERLRPKLGGFDMRKLFLHATHTHTAPEVIEGQYEIPKEGVMQPTEYLGFLLDRLTQIALAAWQNRRPAGVSWGLGHAVVGHNRRAVYHKGQAIMYGETDRKDFSRVEGYEDHSVDMLFFWDSQSRLTGVAINLACPSQVVEGESYVSADFWDDVRKELRKRYSADLFVYPMTGAAGDQSPHFLLGRRAEARLRERRGVSETEEIAWRIANAVDYVLPGAQKDIRFQVPFQHEVEDLPLPLEKVTDAAVATARADYERLRTVAPSDPASYVKGLLDQNVIARYERQDKDPNYTMELHVLRLGDIALATNPFELYLDYGIRIKAWSPAEQTFLIELACDVGGYLPTARAVEGGGYSAEIDTYRVGPKGGQALVDRTVELIRTMWEGGPAPR